MRLPATSLLLILFTSAATFAQTAGQSSTKKTAPAPPQMKAPASQAPAKPAQTQAPAQSQQQPAANPDSVPADATVMTLANVCQNASPASQPAVAAGSSGCTQTITKAEFEKVADAVNAPAQAHDRLAQAYARLLIMSAAAEKRGLDKDPKTQTLIKLAQLQAVAQELNQRVLKQANDVPPEQIDKYYREHAQDFQQAKLRRLIIPKTNAGKPLDEAKQKQLAESLQKRAAAGEDFDKLQKEAFTSSGVEQTPPPTDLGQRRHGSLPKEQDDVVFSLQPGKVSDVVDDTTSRSGFYIFKVDSKDAVPLDSVRPEIKQRLAEETYGSEMRSIFQGADAKLNPQYFGTDHLDLNLPAQAAGPGPRPIRPAAPQQ
jgi:PPIC-type PPIASE domain